MPTPFMCHWCDKPTMNESGICIECEQKYEEGNKDIAGTIRELETRVRRYEKSMKEILDCCDLKNTFILSSDDTAFACDIKDIAQASLDGEPTTADKSNVVYISDVNKEIAKKWKNDTMQEDEKLVFEEQFEEGGKFAGVNLKDREREEKIKKKANMIESIGYREEE